MPQAAFEKGTAWFRLQYEINSLAAVNEAGENTTYRIIVAKLNSGEVWYNPLEYRYCDEKQPKNSDSEEQFWGPHIHLARINLEDVNQILGFVNKWGLLGLWENAHWKHCIPFLTTAKEGPKDLDGNEEFSGWYRWEPYLSYKEKYLHSLCEPLELFVQATQEYQNLCHQLSENDAAARWNLREKLQYCVAYPSFDRRGTASFAWQCPSLLDWIYLLTFLDLVEGKRRFLKCKKCGRLSLSASPEIRYCSETCRLAANTAKSERRGRIIKALEIVRQKPQIAIEEFLQECGAKNKTSKTTYAKVLAAQIRNGTIEKQGETFIITDKGEKLLKQLITKRQRAKARITPIEQRLKERRG